MKGNTQVNIIIAMCMNLLDLPGLDLMHGPMFSGKTSELIRKLSVYNELGLNILYVNHFNDNRSSANFSSHNPKVALPNNVKSCKTSNLQELKTKKEFEAIDVIGIDEAQFFNDLYVSVLEFIEKYNKRILVAGLDSDWKRQRFGQVLDLVPHAEETTKLYSFCVLCKSNNKIKKAIYTKRLVNEKDTVIVGGKDKYIACCRECY